MNLDCSVILSTYNQPEWLEKSLLGYSVQSHKNFEIIIADDGSGKETKELIKVFKNKMNVPVIHIWQEDQEFQKTKILNKCLKVCCSDYIIISDGDCIPKHNLVEVHLDFRKTGSFLSGGYCKLSREASKSISKEDILNKKIFDSSYKNLLQPLSWKSRLKLYSNDKLSKFLNKYTTTKATWNGHNSSAWKEDILKVNGFDERMKYGGMDRELGERLMNLGLKGTQIRYSALCLHLDHPRGYSNEEDWKSNNQIRQTVKGKKLTWTDYGLIKKKTS